MATAKSSSAPRVLSLRFSSRAVSMAAEITARPFLRTVDSVVRTASRAGPTPGNETNPTTLIPRLTQVRKSSRSPSISVSRSPMASMPAKTVPTPGITEPAACTMFQLTVSLVSLRSHWSSFSLLASISSLVTVLIGLLADCRGRVAGEFMMISPGCRAAVRKHRCCPRVF